MDRDGGASLASTIPEDTDEDARRSASVSRGRVFTAAEDRAIAAAVHAYHDDAAALARYRDASLHASGAARTYSWDAITALFAQRTGSAWHTRGAVSSRYYQLLARGAATRPAAWQTQVAANAARRRALAALAAAAAGRPPPPQPRAAAPAAAAPRRKRARGAEPAASAAAAARETAAAPAAQAPPAAAAAGATGAAQSTWSAAEEAHLLELLARFPAHGEPSTARGGRGTDADTDFWTRIAACLQTRSAEGSGRTAYAAYKRATMLQQR